MKRILLLLLLLSLGSGGLNPGKASPIQRSHPHQAWSLDLGSGWFEPDDEFYEDWFNHGFNFRAAVNYKFRSRLILGLQYRYSQKRMDIEFHSWDFTPNDLTDVVLTPDVESIDHWIGLRVGYDLVERSVAEISISGLFYLIDANIEQRGLKRSGDGNYFDDFYGDGAQGTTAYEYGETGVGLGASFLFAYSVSKQVALGIDVEYNHTWLDYPDHRTIMLELGENPQKLGPAYFYENVGGFWITPFIRLRF